jgi:hypothetical protein
MERMSHSKGVKALEVALAYAEQQGETSATDVTLLRRRHDLTARKRSKKMGDKLHSFIFLNSNFSVLPYYILNVALN